MLDYSIMRGKFFNSFDGAKIYYHKSLKDPHKWLIFLHGFGGNLTAWQKTRRYFTSLGISSIAMDLRGHGYSSKSEDLSFYNLENFAKDVAVLIKQENITNPVVVGHCFGGMAAIYFQAYFPNYSKGLVLVDTGYKPPFIGSSPLAKTFTSGIINLLLKVVPNIKVAGHADFNKFVGTSDINIRRLASDILHTSLKSYLMMVNTSIKLDATALLDKITVPTLVVEGTKDIIFPPAIATYLNQRIKTSELELIEGANHIIVINNPEALSKSIEEFLRKINFI